MIFSPRRKKRAHRFAWFILITAVGLALFAAQKTISLLQNIPGPESITERNIIESTKIFDRTGKILLYEIHGEEKRTVVPFSEIPEHVKQAALAAEDLYFYEHGGLDWRAIVRAAGKNILRGEITQGGSTITQQLVKKALLSDERTYSRKIKEALLSILVERQYSKDEIFEWYLNQIPYGSNAYGIAAAAETFLGKEVKDLSAAEAALLAALPKAPTYYSPYGSHKEELSARKNWIIERMAEAKFIPQEEVDKLKNAKLTFLPPRQSIRAPHFTLYVREYLNEKYGEDFVERGGLRVTTTLDWAIQEEAERAVLEGAEQNEKAVQAANATLVAIDPRTGEILALAGSKDYWGSPWPEKCNPGINCRFDPHVNVALRPRQPGSAFKPFVYATAFQKGYTPETALFDVPTEFNSSCLPDGTKPAGLSEEIQCYHPRNYDGGFRGPVTLRQSIAQSLNVPSVKLLYLAGVEDSIKTAEALGISTLADSLRYGLSLVLGGAEVTLLDMTSAFGAFARDGELYPKTAILKIETADEAILEEKKGESLRVLDENVARTINDVLSDNEARVPVFSPQSSLYFPTRAVAAKTGTTQDYRDAWVIGYTPSLVAGVWVGNNDNTPMHQSSISVMVAGPIWHRFMENVLAKSAPEQFPRPEKKSPEKPALRGIYRAGEILKIDSISKKLATALTPPEFIQEIGTGEIKTILSYIRKEDPLGSPPSDPANDPQRKNWQEAIDKWLLQNPLTIPIIPIDFDDVHIPEKSPKIMVLAPNTTFPLAAPLYKINIRISAMFPLQEISLFIDDNLTESRTSPFAADDIVFTLASPLEFGEYKIKITAYDAVGNKGLLETKLTLQSAPPE
ncbi:MAG: transglycosylase domain-containing protein [Candidatus Sungbacteria bacterium]|nr:transglycosylase domain-containing protein [Candidatus Sungbacteria bacterium]